MSTPILTTGGVTTGKRRVNGYKFPILKPTELLQCLSQLGACTPNITLDELEEPQHCKEKIRQIFLFLLSYCAGKDEKDFKPTKKMLDHVGKFDFPELHKPESFTEMQFFLALRKLFSQCLYNEFSWRDLHLPTSKRLRIQLSAVINLVKYLEGEQIKIFNELNGPRSELIQAYEEAQAEREDLQRAYEVVEEKAKQNRAEMEEIMRECEELEVEIARNNRLQTASRQEAAAIKKKANELNDQLQTAQWALQEVEAEEERLRSQIVSSPQRRKEEMKECQERLEHEKRECARLDEEIQQCKVKYANGLKLLQEFNGCLKDMDELKTEALKYTDMVEKLREIETKSESIEKAKDDINIQIVDCERELFRIEEKIKSQRAQQKMKMEALQESLDRSKQDLLKVEKDRREAMTRIDAGEKEIRTLQVVIEQEASQSEHEIQEMIARYKQLELKYLEKDKKRLQRLGAHEDQSNKENCAS